MIDTEVAVIGSGPGGAMTAALLAEAGKEVVLIERGPYLHLSSCLPFSLEEMRQKYHHGGMTAALGCPKVAYVEGNCVGGGSEVNAGLYHRTPREVLDNWAQRFDLKDVDEASCRLFFEENERDVNVSFMPENTLPLASLMLHQGANALGWKSMEVPRWYSYAKDGNGTKQSMTETFVPRALRAGAVLHDGMRVTKVKRRGDRWLISGVRSDPRNTSPLPEHVEVRARFLFVCAGTIETSAILRRNGLSARAGNSLQMHPSIKLVARFRSQINDKNMGVPVHQVKEFSPRISLGCSISTPTYLSLAMIDVPNGEEIVRNHWHHMAVYYAMSRAGMGKVRTLPGFRDPMVKFDVGTDGVRDVLDGLLKLGECLFESGAIEVYPVTRGSIPLRSMADLRRYVDELSRDRLNLMTIHLMSSCPMGENKNICVTDSYGRLHGHEGIYVNDASLLCTSLGVNPQGSVMMVARRNCENFLQEN